MKTLIVMLLFTLPALGQGKDAGKQASHASDFYPDYSKATYLGTREIRLFVDDPRKTKYLLLTSWIPGSEHKGFFRYRLAVTVMDASANDQLIYRGTPPSQGWGISETVARINACYLYLNVYDEGGFVLQKIPLVFTRTVDDQMVVTGLSANDSIQMDLNNYKSFLAAKIDSSWDIGWSCPSK